MLLWNQLVGELVCSRESQEGTLEIYRIAQIALYCEYIYIQAYTIVSTYTYEHTLYLII